MATPGEPTDAPAFREAPIDAPSETPSITVVQADALETFQTFGQYLGHPASFEMATTAEPIGPSLALRQMALDDPADPVVVNPYYSEEPPRFYTLDGTPLPPAPTRLRVPQPRRRASRGRPIRRRGSRRTTAPTRDGPEDGDPDPPGVGDTGGVTTSQVFAASLSVRGWRL